jgi:Niemann-Pick C1 protein
MTYFIACITLDERRIQDRRRDCLTCITAKSDDASEGNQETVNQAESKVDLFMAWYGEKLLKPWVKGAVILCFTAILIACSFSAAKLEQAFEFTDVLPSGSYVADFFEALDDYSARSSTTPGVYFRNVDQSDPAVQDQMEKYVNELITIEAIVEQPAFFWLRDFKMFVNRTSGASTLDFNSQVDAFLSDSVFRELYGEDIIRDNSGSIVTSRLFIPMDNVDLESIDEQIDALKDQRAISDAQAINKGKDEYCFFTYEGKPREETLFSLCRIY